MIASQSNYQLSRGVTLTPSLVFTQQYVCLSLWWVYADDKQWSRLALASWKLSSLASWKLSSDECRNSNSETVTHKHTHARLSRLRRVAAALFRLSWRLNFTLKSTLLLSRRGSVKILSTKFRSRASLELYGASLIFRKVRIRASVVIIVCVWKCVIKLRKFKVERGKCERAFQNASLLCNIWQCLNIFIQIAAYGNCSILFNIKRCIINLCFSE